MPERGQEELQEEIGRAREDFAMTMDELVNQRFRPRQQLQRHPLRILLSIGGVSLVTGIVLGTVVGRTLGRRTRKPRFLVRL